jgi:8-oxo-dGTP diphosphatase
MTDQHAPGKRPGISAAVITHEGRVLMVRRRIKEGQLSWQFPAGEIQPGESPEQAAVRETHEETGLTVTAVRLLGERVHPQTQRSMSYTACRVESADAHAAHVADTDELAELAWCTRAEIPLYVPYGLFEPVQAYLDDALT